MSKSICVYCASSSAVNDDFFEVAREMGESIARRGYSLVYGGGDVGLMGAVARSVHKHGGRVIGVIPEFLRKPEIAYEAADELIVTATMRERKAIMESRAGAFAALPGGFGTLEEMLEIITLKTLRVHAKPVVFVNSGGFYDGLRDVFEHIFEHKFARPYYRGFYSFVESPEDALTYIENYQPPEDDGKGF